MKASLNASVRDAQLRDSFNKESFILTGSEFARMCAYLYKLQSDLPRNASKLHSLVVLDPNGGQSFLINFEVLRSVTLADTEELVLAYKGLKDSTKLSSKKKGDLEDDN